MNERHLRAVARCVVTALVVGLAAIVLCAVLPMGGKVVVCAVMGVVDLSILTYLFLATSPEPEVRQPSTARAVYERRRRRSGG